MLAGYLTFSGIFTRLETLTGITFLFTSSSIRPENLDAMYVHSDNNILTSCAHPVSWCQNFRFVLHHELPQLSAFHRVWFRYPWPRDLVSSSVMPVASSLKRSVAIIVP